MSFEDPLEEVLNLSTCDTPVEPDSADMTFKNSLDRLTLDTLRILCNAEGLSVSGSKKELADRFALKMASKMKEKGPVELPNSFQVNEDRDNQAGDRLKGNNRRFDQARVFDQSVEFGETSGRVADDTPESVLWNRMAEEKVLEERRFLSLERSLEKSLQATLMKAMKEMKSSLQSAGNRDEDKSWPEVKMDRPRDQFEYNEWRKIGRELDEALLFKSLEPIVRAREIAYTRAYMLRVANKKGWDVASALKDPASEDPLEAFLKEKLMLARQSAHLNPYAQFTQPAQKPYLDQSSMPFYHTTVPQQQLPGQLSQFPPYSQMTQQFFGGQLPVQGPSQRSRLNKAYDHFRKFCDWTGVAEEQINMNMLMAFIG
ncbi:18040_t:CDS:2 [Cetraspora pellucida]|uniref:18040_t:CDS:1 n=1 Tax=Cetraspora pellucida TaxID=1433469 RepID=A0ACA9LQY8_9GLOM|nr:18040_t:CDS:2 [Cetraspora pellucida]